jgi:hypothetical protein
MGNEIGKNLKELSSRLYNLPERDKEFIEGVAKRLIDEIYKNVKSNQISREVGTKIIDNITSCLAQIPSEYSDLLREVRAGNIAFSRGLEAYKRKIEEYTKSLEKSTNEYLERIEKLRNKLLSTYQVFRKRIESDPNKDVKYALDLRAEAGNIWAEKNSTILSSSLGYFVKNYILLHLLSTNIKEVSYDSGIKFAEEKIIPKIREMFEKSKEVDDLYKNVKNFAENIIERGYEGAYKYRGKGSDRSIYLLLILVTVSFLFFISNRETMMSILVPNVSTSLLVFVVLLSLIFFFIKILKKKSL